MTTQSKALVTLEDKAKQLDKVATKFSDSLNFAASPFGAAIALSQNISVLRELLDDGIMAEIMRLADSPLGFLTDKKDRGGYQAREVRDAIIEATLRGFRVCGNEFNIIAGRFYGAKAGLHRKVISYPGVTDFKETFGIPKMSGDKGAIVVAKATWKLNGTKDALEREFAIRVNSGMGVDAIIGKGQRKLYAAVLNQLSGIITPDGEVEQDANGGPVKTLTFTKEGPKIFASEAPQEASSQPTEAQEETPNLPFESNTAKAVKPGEIEDDFIHRETELDQLKLLMVKYQVTTAEILRVCENNHWKVNSLEEITPYYIRNFVEYWDDAMFEINAFRKEAAK